MMRSTMATCVALVLCGCCGYSTRSLLPSHLRTVAVMQVDNATDQPALGENLTDALTAAFTVDRNLRLTTIDDANLVVSATVEGYTRTAASYTGEQNITAYELTVSARVRVQDQVKDAQFYSGTVSSRTTYDPNAKTEEQAASEAITRLAAEIVRQVLTAW